VPLWILNEHGYTDIMLAIIESHSIRSSLKDIFLPNLTLEMYICWCYLMQSGCSSDNKGAFSSLVKRHLMYSTVQTVLNIVFFRNCCTMGHPSQCISSCWNDSHSFHSRLRIYSTL